MLTKVSVSVVIACHDLEKYLDDAIASIAAQTMQPTEVIVVHDGCKSQMPVYEGVTSVIRRAHKGVVRTRHEGVLLSTSDNIIFLDADDVISEYFIESMVKARKDNPGAVLYPNVLLWSRWGKPGEPMHANAWHESPHEINFEAMHEMCPIVVSSMLPRALYDDIGGFEEFPLYEDWHFWHTAFDRGTKFVKVPQAVLKYRQRTGSRNRADQELRNQMFYQIKELHEPKKS